MGQHEQHRWAFECVARAAVTRSEAVSSVVVGEVDAGRKVAVSRLVDAKDTPGVRRMFLPEHGGWVSAVDGTGRVLFELCEPPIQMDALNTRQSLLAFSDGADAQPSARSRKPVSVDLFGLPQTYRQPPCLLEQRAVATEALAKFIDVHGDAGLIDLHPSTELRDLVRQYGVAPSHRRRLWMSWSGAAAMKEARPDGYSALLLKAIDKVSSDQIESDLPRTCPSVSWFASCDGTEPDGIATMRRVLRAFAVDNPTVGYTQSLNFLAAFILLVFERDKLRPGGKRAAEAEEDCFWMLTALTRRCLRGYHTESLCVVRLDTRVFDALLEAKIPKLAAHLTAHNISSLAFISARWLLCCFHGILPAEAVARIFDNMLLARHNAPSMLLRVGLAVLLRASPQLLSCECEAVLMDKLLHSPEEIRTAADIDMLFHSAWHQIGTIPSARAMREHLADAQPEVDLKRWACAAQDLPSSIQPALEELSSLSHCAPSRVASGSTVTCNDDNLSMVVASANKSKRRRGRARVWGISSSAALAKAASTLGVGGMESWLAVEGEGPPPCPLARALSDRDVNKPLPLPSPVADGACPRLNRTHSRARRAVASARKIHAQDFHSHARTKTSKKRDVEDCPEGIELTDLRGLSDGKRMRLLCDGA